MKQKIVVRKSENYMCVSLCDMVDGVLVLNLFRMRFSAMQIFRSVNFSENCLGEEMKMNNLLYL